MVSSENKNDVLACLGDTYGEEIYFYNPYGNAKARLVMDFDLGEHFFSVLNEYEIVEISVDTHICLWNYIEEIYMYSAELPENLNKYLLYCKNKDRTLRRLRKMCDRDLINLKMKDALCLKKVTTERRNRQLNYWEKFYLDVQNMS